MRTKQSIISSLLVFILLATANLSCNTTRKAVSCPEISLSKSDYRAQRKIRTNHRYIAHNNKFKSQKLHRSKKVQKKEYIPYVPIAAVESNSQISIIQYNKSLMASIDNTFHPIYNVKVPSVSSSYNESKAKQDTNKIQEVKCDTIILKSGSIIIGRVEEIGQSELKYRRCNNLTGPIISVLKSDVTKVLYSNGTSDLFGPQDTAIPSQNYYPNQNYLSSTNTTPAKVEGLGLAGFVSSLVGLFIASIPLGIIAIVFGNISLSKIKKNPQRYKGKGFAVASIIIGIVDVVAMIVLLGSL
jgi:hypothetical protein